MHSITGGCLQVQVMHGFFVFSLSPIRSVLFPYLHIFSGLTTSLESLECPGNRKKSSDSVAAKFLKKKTNLVLVSPEIGDQNLCIFTYDI